MNTDAKRCSFAKPDGSTCGAFAIKGSDFCYNHNPSLAEARAASRRAGGLNRHTKFKWHPNTFETLVCFHAADDAIPVMVIPLLDAFLKVRDGRMDTRTANSLAYLATTMAQNWVHGHHPPSYVPAPGTPHARQWDAIIREVFHTDPAAFRRQLVEKSGENPSIAPKDQTQSPTSPVPDTPEGRQGDAILREAFRRDPVTFRKLLGQEFREDPSIVPQVQTQSPTSPAPPPQPAPAPAPPESPSPSPAPAPAPPAPSPQPATPPVQRFDLLGRPIPSSPPKKDPPPPLLPGQKTDLLGNPIPLSPPKKDPPPPLLPGQKTDLLGNPIPLQERKGDKCES